MCHSSNVTPFKIKLNPGQSIFEQIVFGATKAFVSGELPPGTPFPSVRALAADLRIHPNTAHKVIQHLIQERWLEVRPGIGTAGVGMGVGSGEASASVGQSSLAPSPTTSSLGRSRVQR